MATATRKLGFATNAIHQGYSAHDADNALTPPIHLSSTFVFENAAHGERLFSGEQAGHFYTRISNPTLDLLERRLACLEGAEAGLVTASGMGAITSTFWSLVAPGDEVILDKTLYGCTFAFMRTGLAKFGIGVRAVDMADPKNLERAISKRTKIVYFETPANPNMRLVDIARIVEVARAFEAKVIVDNTYATPYLQRPLEHGADLVVHSATKYLGGHGDLVAGAVLGAKEDIDHIRLFGLKDMTGAVLAPFNAMLIMRGLKTLELRMERHSQSALAIAKLLEDHPAVDQVYYPGLASSPFFETAKRQMVLPGGMIAFEMAGGLSAGKAFIDHVELVQRAVSLGDAESLVQHPATMTHSTYTPEERMEHGISDGLVRLSVGLESLDDIAADILRALDAVHRSHSATTRPVSVVA